MLRVEKDCVELQVKLQEVQKRLQTEQSTKMEYQTFTEEQVITIKRLRDENFKLKKHVSFTFMSRFNVSNVMKSTLFEKSKRFQYFMYASGNEKMKRFPDT